MHCSETVVAKLLPSTCSCVPYICASLASIKAVMTNTSSIHGCTRTFKIASLCHAVSTYSLSTFAYCIRTSLCVRATVCTVPFVSSYCCCSSRAFVSKHCMFGSSCRVVSTSNDSSNSLVQSFTALLISVIPIVMALARYSFTAGGVESCAFNCSSVI